MENKVEKDSKYWTEHFRSQIKAGMDEDVVIPIGSKITVEHIPARTIYRCAGYPNRCRKEHPTMNEAASCTNNETIFGHTINRTT